MGNNRTASEDDAKKRNPLDFALWKNANQMKLAGTLHGERAAQDGILDAL